MSTGLIILIGTRLREGQRPLMNSITVLWKNTLWAQLLIESLVVWQRCSWVMKRSQMLPSSLKCWNHGLILANIKKLFGMTMNITSFPWSGIVNWPRPAQNRKSHVSINVKGEQEVERILFVSVEIYFYINSRTLWEGNMGTVSAQPYTPRKSKLVVSTVG